MIGQTISHYHILEKLGEGGMGVVYKAEDTKLKRTVALKFLPFEFTSDQETKERFMREAQAASSLDHPNICTVYEIGETEEGQMFIAMACYEGESLREKVARGPLKVDEAIGIAIQIAEGLAEAHKRGVIHRDIKPANVLITKNDVAKIVDFGLAKVSGATRLTKSRSTLGTIAYMAPEQLQGGEVDARSDVFSLGVVLYEMLSGKMPFRGEHEAALMYSVMNEEPKPLRKLIPEISPELNQIITKTLEKDPKDRYQSMDEFLSDLKPLQQEVTASPSPVTRRIVIDKRSARKIIIAAILLTVVFAWIAFLLLTQKKDSVPSGQMATRVLRVPSNEPWDSDISPDGNWITYVIPEANGGSNVYIQAASGGEPKKIIGDTLYLSRPCFSPEATEILYQQDYRYDKGTGRLIHIIYTVSILGGVPRKIINDGEEPKWSPDGKTIAFMRNNDTKTSVWMAGPDGSSQQELKEGQGEIWSELAWSPDSRKLAYVRDFRGVTTRIYSEIFILEISSGRKQQLTFDKNRKSDLCWAATDEIIFNSMQGSNMNIWTVSAHGGVPRQLTSETGHIYKPRTSKDAKHLVYLLSQLSSNLWITNLETKQARQLTFDEGFIVDPTLSPQGNKLLYRWLHGGFGEVFVSNADGTDRVQIHTIPGFPGVVRWSGDGKAIAYSANRSDTVSFKPDSIRLINEIFIQKLETESPQKIGVGILTDWSSDGKYMLFQEDNTPANEHRYSLAPTPMLDKPMYIIESEIKPSFTKDSKNVLYTDSARLWNLSIENGQRRVLCTLPKGFWEIYDMPDGKSVCVEVASGTARTFFKLSKATKRFDRLFEVSAGTWGASFSPDLKMCVYSKFETRNKIIVVDNFR